MNNKDKKLFLAAALIILSKATFLISFVLLFKIAFGFEANLAKASLLLSLGVLSGTLGFYFTGASKTAWLQIPHQILAILGICVFFYGGLALFKGASSSGLLILVTFGPIITASWWYCDKKNIYKA